MAYTAATAGLTSDDAAIADGNAQVFSSLFSLEAALLEIPPAHIL